MKFRFPSQEACEQASNELSNHFSGNGVHYETHSYDKMIVILSSCPDSSRARSICQKYGGS